MRPIVEIRRHSPGSSWTYGDLDRYQRKLSLDIQGDVEGSALHALEPGRILISELAPVITLGRRECSQDVLFSEQQLNEVGIELYPTDRGGRATYHGPGQWVVFVVDRLDRMTGDRRGVRKAVEGLLETARTVGREFLGDAVHLKDGAATGVWTSQGKLASVGVQIEAGVLLHGLAINGYRTSQSFLGLKPCGLDAQVDFLLPEVDVEKFSQIPARIVQELHRHFWLSS